MRAGHWEAELFLVHARADWNQFARRRTASSDSREDSARSADKQLSDVLAGLEANLGGKCDPRAPHVE
jgi:hypothetical protein